MASNTVAEVSNFSGESNVKVILDGEEIEFKLKSNGKPILDILESFTSFRFVYILRIKSRLAR